MILKYNHTNDTDSYQVVANYHIVIASGLSREQCRAEIEKIDIDNSPWGVVDPVAPGQSISGELESPDVKAEEQTQYDDIFGFGLPDEGRDKN